LEQVSGAEDIGWPGYPTTDDQPSDLVAAEQIQGKVGGS